VRSTAGVGVDLCKLFEVEIQPLVVRLDERILLEMLRFIASCSADVVGAFELQAPDDDCSADVASVLKPAFIGALASQNTTQIIFEVMHHSLYYINLCVLGLFGYFCFPSVASLISYRVLIS
jgi:hypothetical protein